MSGGKAKRRRDKKRWLNRLGRTKAYPCLHCGQPEAHFVPPSFGQHGFYTCDPNAKLDHEWDYESMPGYKVCGICDGVYAAPERVA